MATQEICYLQFSIHYQLPAKTPLLCNTSSSERENLFEWCAMGTTVNGLRGTQCRQAMLIHTAIPQCGHAMPIHTVIPLNPKNLGSHHSTLVLTSTLFTPHPPLALKIPLSSISVFRKPERDPLCKERGSPLCFLVSTACFQPALPHGTAHSPVLWYSSQWHPQLLSTCDTAQQRADFYLILISPQLLSLLWQ